MEGTIDFATLSLEASVPCPGGTEGGAAGAVDVNLVRRCDVGDDDDDDGDDVVAPFSVAAPEDELEDLETACGVVGVVFVVLDPFPASRRMPLLDPKFVSLISMLFKRSDRLFCLKVTKCFS